MQLCGDFGISPSDFWRSTPNEFNGLLRGSLVRQQREARLMLPLYHSKKALKTKDILGWELTDDNEGFGTEKAKPANVLDNFDSLEEKIEYKKTEIKDLFDSFDDF